MHLVCKRLGWRFYQKIAFNKWHICCWCSDRRSGCSSMLWKRCSQKYWETLALFPLKFIALFLKAHIKQHQFRYLRSTSTMELFMTYFCDSFWTVGKIVFCRAIMLRTQYHLMNLLLFGDSILFQVVPASSSF